MRLQYYLTESYKRISDDDIDALIQKECKPLIKQLKGKTLYRGIKISANSFKAIPRKDRTPKDTPIEMQNLFDDICQKLFGWRPRSQGVFVTGGAYQAQTYGSVYEVYPTGNFKFIYSPKIHDFYTEMRGELNLYRQKYSLQSHPAEAIIKKPGFRDTMTALIKGKYTDKDLYNAAFHENEIMILCKSYYGKIYDDTMEM